MGINAQEHSIPPEPSNIAYLPSHLAPDSCLMISSPCYPYPVNDQSPPRRAALQPHIYSPSESRSSPRHAMYPHLHASGSPSPNYIYAGYDHCCPKDSWASAIPSSWPTLYPFPRSSFTETTVNPKVTIHPPPPVLVTDIDTPSSTSSLAVLTPPSPFARHDVGDVEVESMDSFDEFDCDDDDDYIDSDFADEMEGVDGADERPLAYGAVAPHVAKSTSSLEGALLLDDTSYDPDVFAPAGRKLSASVPGASHRPAASSHQRLTSPPAAPDTSYPAQQHTHTQRNVATARASPPSLYTTSSSLAGAFTSSVSPRASRPLPILQPQPIRPIPPIPLAELTSSAHELRRSPSRPPSLRTLSPLPLLCQPVSDAVRYQLKEPPSLDAGGVCFDLEGNASESMCDAVDVRRRRCATPSMCDAVDVRRRRCATPSMCDAVDVTTASRNHQRFAPHGLTFCQERHPSAGGSCSVGDRVYSCGWTRR